MPRTKRNRECNVASEDLVVPKDLQIVLLVERRERQQL